MEILLEFWQLLVQFADFFLHLDKHVNVLIQSYGVWTYLILFLIVFCETGLVVTPFLPGDSLLFAIGTFCASGSLSLATVLVLLSIAAILGDAVNYAVGSYMGPKVLTENRRFLKRAYLEQTQRFYEKYGGKTIIFARFVPIVRTFAPFLAGVGRMSYARFGSFNIIGGLAWICSFTLAGNFFGNIPVVKKNFTLVIFAIILVSVLPAALEVLKARKGVSRKAIV